MSRAAQKLISASGGKAYEIKQSLLCSQADASKLRRTPSSEGNRKTFTFSTWCKRSSLGTGGSAGSDYHSLFGAFVSAGGSTDDSHYFSLNFRNDNTLTVGGWATNWRITNRTFRDCSAWYHIVLQVDTTQSTASNRIKLYVNGVEETSFSTNNNPSQNYDLAINNTVAQSISDTAYDSGTGPYHFDGYMAETHLFDGAVVAPSEFGETDSVTGQWIPKKYVGTSSYGTNGYYMPWKKNDRYSPYFTGANTTGIAVADSTDWDFGSGDFTMEAWVYRHEDLGQDGYVMGQCSSSTGANAGCSAFLLVGSNNTLYGYAFDASNTNNYVTLNGGSVADNKWYHVAMSRNGSTWKLFLDGTAVSTVTSSIAVNNVGDVFGVGKLGIYTAGHWQGWISNARVVKGTAVYTSDFTPSTTPLTAVTNTVLLCCQDKNVTTDNSGTSKSLSVTASQVWTEQMAPFEFDWYQDQSGQDNHYQADNLTVDDVMLDSPTNNFATLNPLMGNGASGYTFEQGNLKSKQTSLTSETAKSYSTMAFVSGKWYAEVSCSAGNVYTGHGVVNVSQSSEGFDFDSSTNNVSAFAWGDRIFKNGSETQNGLNSTASSTNILGIALDLDNGTVQFYSNGSTSGNAETLTRNTGDLFVFCDAADSGGYASNSAYEWNFGQNGTHCGTKTAGGNADGNGIGDYMYSVPSGFLAPCSANLATPAVKKPTEHFNIATYTGDASSEGSGDEQAITGVGFQPDFVWLKARSTGANHLLHDVIRGPTKFIRSDTTDAEGTQAEGLKSFDSDGFTVGDSNAWNQNSRTLVAWNWKAGGSGSANNSGDINATVSANPTAGFSIVSWTGNSSNGDTIAHGLGKVPSVIFYKNREASSLIYVVTTAIDGSQDYLALGSTTFAAASTWGAPATNTISNWTFGANDIIAYVWAEIEGFSKFGSYEGNGNAAGPFVNTGFRPAYVMLKSADATYSWRIIDNKRNPYNVMDDGLWADLSNAESASTSNLLDFYSNGFKLRGSGNGTNKSGDTYLYMAFAEFPFKYANAR